MIIDPLSTGNESLSNRIITSMYLENQSFHFFRVILDFCFIFVGSMIVGWLIGMVCALVISFFLLMRHFLHYKDSKVVLRQASGERGS